MLLRSDVEVIVGSVRDKPTNLLALKAWRSASLFTNGVPDARESRGWGKWHERERGQGHWWAAGVTHGGLAEAQEG